MGGSCTSGHAIEDMQTGPKRGPKHHTAATLGRQVLANCEASDLTVVGMLRVRWCRRLARFGHNHVPTSTSLMWYISNAHYLVFF